MKIFKLVITLMFIIGLTGCSKKTLKKEIALDLEETADILEDTAKITPIILNDTADVLDIVAQGLDE